jgi:4-amino-4-deoxy-L-arabinose transferase-like glycosyltransferase
VAVYLILTVAYAFVNPVFEAPDEHHHFYTAHYIATTGQLPTVPEDWDPLLGQEAAQPPLYYVLAAGVLRPFKLDGMRDALWLNPFARLGDTDALNNRNRVVQHPAMQPVAQAAHAVRLLSVAFGVGTLMCIIGAAQLLWPTHPRRALLAGGVVACLPQFNFVNSYANNDSLIIFLASAALWQLIALWQRPTDTRWARYLLLGATIGLAQLTKMAGLLLLAYSLGFLAVALWRRRARWRTWLQATLGVAASALLISGWLYWRNWRLYADPFATEPFIRIAGGDRGYSLLQVLTESGGLWQSLFGVFGWFNIKPGIWFFVIWGGVVLLALVGAVALTRQRAATPRLPEPTAKNRWSPPLALLLAGWPLLVYAGMVSFMLRTPAAQGRLLFPALLPLALGLAFGLSYWTERFGRIRLPAIALGGGALVSLSCLLLVIQPVYNRPKTVDSLPPNVEYLDADLGYSVDIVGAAIVATTLSPSEPLWLDLYWRSDNPPATAPDVVVEIFGRPQPGDAGGTLGRLQTLHGGGLYPASLWKAGEIIHSRLGIMLKDDLVVPTTGRVNVRLVGGGGHDVGMVKVVPKTWPSLPAERIAAIGERVDVVSAELLDASGRPQTLFAAGDVITMRIIWRVTAPLDKNYTTLVHLGQPGEPPLAQADAPPLAGFYPTNWWSPGDNFVDNYALTVPSDLPAGRYQVQFGLYDNTFARLPVMASGSVQIDAVVSLAVDIVDNSPFTVDK